MGWDAARPVPYRRLTKEWLIYAAVMTVLLTVVFRSEGRLVPILGGLLVSLPLYLLFGYVLAKFGYSRKTLADMKTPRASSGGSSDDDDDEASSRPRPAPTKRTSTGPNRPPGRSKRR
jgi:hypothetical protein